jgi:hypothetical protein
LKQLAAAAALVISVGGMGAAQPTTASAIRTSSASRATYLARAKIWSDPGTISPDDVLKGPTGALPFTYEQTTLDPGIGCRFVQAGKEIGGGSKKFFCRTTEGRELRVKFWDREARRGNREVFSTVAASRLLWSLGFNAVPALSMDVLCDGCPENPHEGTGKRQNRRYVAMLQAPWPTPVIHSSDDLDQGWSWGELDRAIQSLPPGSERVRQRTHFDALTLLGVFMQHGDRKGQQQQLSCASPADATAGKQVPGKDNAGRLTLIEHTEAVACATPAVTIADVGVTFGGAGLTSSDTTATMNLEHWRQKRVFLATSGTECQGDLIVSLRAGRDGEGNPRISEEGRGFLLEQLHRLSPEHVRAIFNAARIDELDARSRERSGNQISQVDAWVEAFERKVRQIEERRCQPAE